MAQSINLPVPRFKKPLHKRSDAGQVKLIWMLPDSISKTEIFNFELQQARDSLFRTAKTIYSGSDLASFISGLPDGSYYYRIRAQEQDKPMSEWSNPVVLDVQHQSLQLAFTLFGIGMVVFLATCAVIFFGIRQVKKEALNVD